MIRRTPPRSRSSSCRPSRRVGWLSRKRWLAPSCFSPATSRGTSPASRSPSTAAIRRHRFMRGNLRFPLRARRGQVALTDCIGALRAPALFPLLAALAPTKTKSRPDSIRPPRPRHYPVLVTPPKISADEASRLLELDSTHFLHPQGDLAAPQGTIPHLIMASGRGATITDVAGRVNIVSRIRDYHGLTWGATSATGLAGFWKGFEPVAPGFLHAPSPDPYRFAGEGSPGAAYVDALEKVIVDAGPNTVAAVVAEPVQGAGGVIVPPPDYFPLLRKVCDRHGVLLIADEVITGFGRTGKWFAMEHWGVQADMMIFAKGVTS